MNATKHGLLSQAVVLTEGESEETFSALADELHDALRPVGALQTMLVDRITALAWRLRRALRIEREVLDREVVDARHLAFSRERHPLGLAFIRDCNGAGAVDRLSRYETSLERSLFRAMKELRSLQTGGAHVETNETQ